MKKFVFSLQTLFDLKKDEEERRKKRMQAIEARVAQFRREYESLLCQIAAARDEYFGEAKRGASAERLLCYGRHIGFVHERAAAKLNELLAAEREKERCRLEQIETRRDIKSLEKLYDEQYAEYKLAEKAEQEQLVGDLVTFRAVAT